MKIEENNNKEIDENNCRAEIFSRTRRVIKVVCRDSLNLLDPPIDENVNDCNIPTATFSKMLNDQENGNGNDNDNENKNESNKKNNAKRSMTVEQHHSSVSHPAHLTPTGKPHQ